MVTTPEIRTPKQLQTALHADPSTYTESVGRHNKQLASEILAHPTGEGTVVRLFFGATRQMPLRGMSYVISALRIAEHLPHEQVQVVFTNTLGHRINGIDRDVSSKQAKLLRELGRRFIESGNPSSSNEVSFCEDSPLDAVDLLRPVVKALVDTDEGLTKRLASKGAKHGSDYATYSAAHVIYQETDQLVLDGLTAYEPAPVPARQIVSIGCQQEHPFYDLRVKARQHLSDIDYLATAQIFTKHVLPPYYMARGGEQSLEDALSNGVDLSLVRDSSAARDTNYLLSQIPEEEIRL